MKIRQSVFATLLGLFLVLISASPSWGQDDRDGEILRNEFLGIELTIPEGWYNATAAGEQEQVVLASREKDKAYLLLSRLPGQKRTLESFDRSTRHYVFTKMQGFLDEERHTEVSGHPAYLWIYQGRSNVDENGWRKFYRVIAEKDNDFVVFHGVLELEDFPKYRGSLEEMINSINWINTESIGE